MRTERINGDNGFKTNRRKKMNW